MSALQHCIIGDTEGRYLCSDGSWTGDAELAERHQAFRRAYARLIASGGLRDKARCIVVVRRGEVVGLHNFQPVSKVVEGIV